MPSQMAGIFRASLAASLRHNFASLWLKSLLFCPRSTTILGDQDLVEVLLEKEVPCTLGVATPGADTLRHSFVATEDGIQWFDFWTRERRLWWKRHGYERSHYDNALIDVDCCQVVYKRDNVIETLTKKYHGSTVVIRSEIDLKAAVRWIQEDARCEGREGQCYRLHYKLAPYQASVAITSEDLRLRATQLLSELKAVQVRCLPVVRLVPSETSRAVTFAEEDSLGVCYNVCLEKHTASDDIVEIRSRDTGTSEHLFTSQVAKMLAKYLKTEAAFVVDEPLATPPEPETPHEDAVNYSALKSANLKLAKVPSSRKRTIKRVPSK